MDGFLRVDRATSLMLAILAGLGTAGGCARGGNNGASLKSRTGAAVVRGPADSEIPEGPQGAAIRRGLALLLATRDSLPANVSNTLRCVSCHLDEGRRETGSWVGSYARFPTYRPRSATVETIEFRINDCFKRSMNGQALDYSSPAMRDMVAYLAFLSRGRTIGDAATSTASRRFLTMKPDTAAGTAIYASACAKCHGPNGEGTPGAPPVWGPQSYNIGAGMARVSTAANFVQANMPFDRPGSLTDQQALDVAAFVNSRPRRDFPGKEYDWPNGDAPPDAAYPTVGVKRTATVAPPRTR